jgi:hypothetical protein
MGKDITELENATDELLIFLNEATYRVEHFIRKSNKSTALDVRNTLRQVDEVKKAFKDHSIAYFDKD